MVELMHGVVISSFALYSFGIIVLIGVVMFMGIIYSNHGGDPHPLSWMISIVAGLFWLLTAISTGCHNEHGKHDACVANNPTSYVDRCDQ